MRILGIDYGDVRVGLAVCDPTEFLASGIGNVVIKGMNDAVEKGIMIGGKRIAMTSTKNQFTVINLNIAASPCM